MNGLKTSVAATLFLAVLLRPDSAPAMEIWQFDKMTGPDQAEFIGVLVQGAEKVLTDAGRPDQAAQVSSLFTTNAPDNSISAGMQQFMVNLAVARHADEKRLEQDPNVTRLEVEHAMILTLKENNVLLPQSFMTVAKDFTPRFPPRKN